MIGLPTVKIRHASYEIVVADCPSCQQENIFNRVSDLETTEEIGGLDVSCLTCGKPFRIVSDSINCRHELLVFECHELIERKRYMNTVLNLVQAYEVFFSLYFRIELLYKPLALDPGHNIEEMNRLAAKLYDRIKNCTFAPMRSLFLQHILLARSPKDWAEAASDLAALSPNPTDPKDAAIEALSDVKLVTLLKAVKSTRIHELRNHVVHHRAYRPTLTEVKDALSETRNTLLPLTHRLELRRHSLPYE